MGDESSGRIEIKSNLTLAEYLNFLQYKYAEEIVKDLTVNYTRYDLRAKIFLVKNRIENFMIDLRKFEEDYPDAKCQQSNT